MQLLDHSQPDTATALWSLLQQAYQREAELLKVRDFPPLRRTADDIRTADSIFLGHFINDRLCAAVEIEDSDEELVIDSLAVDPQFWRQGLASLLLTEVIAMAAGRTLAVSTGRDNHPAILLYEKFGFKQYRQWTSREGIALTTLRLSP